MVSEAAVEGGDTAAVPPTAGGRRGSWPPSRISLLEGTYNVEYLGMFKLSFFAKF